MKMNVCLYWVTDKYKDEGGRYVLTDNQSMNGHRCDVTGDLWNLVGQREVDFDVSDFDARDLVLSAPKQEKADIIAKATAKAEAIEEKIQQLLALPASVSA